MTHTRNDGDGVRPKISAEFASGLNELDPEQMVRAILLLRAQRPVVSHSRQNRMERRAAMDEMRSSAEHMLDALDEILVQYDGHRQVEKPDVFGAIPIETTVEGIRALAKTEWVRAILEDQPIRGELARSLHSPPEKGLD